MKSMWLSCLVAWNLCAGWACGQWVRDGETWRADTLYTIVPDGLVIVPPGATLTIEPGTEVRFSGYSKLIVGDGGTCVANGVKFTHCSPSEPKYTTSGNIIADGTTEWPADAQRSDADVEFITSSESGKFGETQWANDAPMGTSVLFWEDSSSEWVGCAKSRKGWTDYNRMISAGEVFLTGKGIGGGPGGEAAVEKNVLQQTDCVIVFFANGGTGNMDVLNGVKGTPLTLPPNRFVHDKFCFAGWAITEDGAVVYGDGAEVTPEGNMTLYAVWVGKIQLCVDRADPAAESLTLAWEEEQPVEGVTYSVWRGTGEERSAAVCVTNGVTGNTWTDEEYWAAEPVLEPLKYWVVADDGGENERVSEAVETRRRYGVFVGLNEEQGFAADARLCQTLASGMGGFGECELFTGGGVNSGAIRGKVAEFADKAQPGDLFMLYISTHGGEGVLSMANDKDEYDVGELQQDVRKFDPGVAVVGVVMACHSGSMLGNGIGSEKIISWLLDAGAADCRPNIAWVTSCGYGQYSLLRYGGGGNASPTPFGMAFLQNGWRDGCADGRLYGTGWNGGNGDGMVTFCELARYAAEFAKGYSDDVAPAGVRVENEELLKRLVAGAAGAVGSGQRPDAPAGCSASMGNSDASIQVRWDLSHDTAVQSYWLFRKGPGETTAKCVSRFAGNGEFSDPGSIRATGLPAKGLKSPEAFKIYTYHVRAVSPRGVSEASPEASGFAGTTVLRQWLEELGFSVAEGIEAADATLAANGRDSILACYVTGLDPNDPDASFKTELVREEGAWKAKPVGGWKAGRIYRVEGKKTMEDEAWTDVTGVEDVEAEGWRFFRVGVGLGE